MTNRKHTRRALLSAFMALVMCCSMFVGTTFAWFTDTAKTGVNKIQAGTLKVDLLHKDAANNSGLAEDGWVSVKDNPTHAILDYDLWEPGYTQYETLKVVNEGTLALKFKLTSFVDAGTAITYTDKNGVVYDLADVIDVYVADGEVTKPANFAVIENSVEANDGKWRNAGTLKALMTDADGIAYGVLYSAKDSDAEKAALSSATMTVALHMREEAGNEYQGLYLGKMYLNLLATQQTYESDSFDDQYDKNAEYEEASGWDGESEEAPAEDADGVYHITTAAELAGLQALMAEKGNNIDVVLDADINLDNNEWTPITGFTGTFNGNGHTIYNLNTEAVQFAGLFGNAYATITNVNIDSATVVGGHWVGAIAGYNYGDITNCTVTNSTITGKVIDDDNNGDKVGGIVGQIMESSAPGYSVSGNTVKNVYIVAGRDVGGIAGAVARANEAVLKNNTVEDVTIVYSIAKDYETAAPIISQRLAVSVDDSNVAENVTIVNGEVAADGVVKTAEKSYEVMSKEGLLNVNAIIAESSTGEGQGIKVKLLADVDLAGETWKPIDKMWVEFDGNGHTISNLKTEAWKAGLFGYLGGGSIKNLTLENVDVTGSQAGAFAGSIEGTIDNCVLKGTNTITWAEKHQYDDPTANIEAWSGIGAITGVAQPSTINVEIAEGATVTLNYGAIKTEAPYVDRLTGYIASNKGTVVNNGTIVVKEIPVEYTVNGVTVKMTASAYNSIGYHDRTGYTDKVRDITVYCKEDLNAAVTLRNAGVIVHNGTNDIAAQLFFGADIDFGGEAFAGFGKGINIFGNGFTLSNVKFIAGTDGKAGFIPYAGNNNIENLTIKDATVEGAQAGVFAGNASKVTLTNCALAGNISVTYVDSANESYNGVGAVFGVNAEGASYIDVDVTAATITIVTDGITYEAGKTAESNNLVGVIYGGTVTLK